MKILFISPIRDASGWSANGINTALALDAAGVDVVVRCVKFSQRCGEVPQRVLELEQKSSSDCDIIIQNCLPPTMDFNGAFRSNIAYYFTETNGFGDTSWPAHINTLDQAWVPSQHARQASESSGVTVPIKVVPCSVDVSRFGKSHKPHRIRDENPDSFIFYFIGEATRRKNLAALVQAFHLEFEPIEPVELLLKVSVPGQDPEAAKAGIQSECETIKRDLNLYPSTTYYKREMIYTDFMSDESIDRLHSSCDCFVSPTFGEGWGEPIIDASGFGKAVITTACSAMLDYLTKESAWLVGCHKVPVLGMLGHGDLYTGRQTWWQADVQHLRHCMREAYENRELREAKAEVGMANVYNYSYNRVGAIMRGLLES